MTGMRNSFEKDINFDFIIGIYDLVAMAVDWEKHTDPHFFLSSDDATFST